MKKKGGLWEGAETHDSRIEREVAAGLHPEGESVDSEVIIPLGVIVIDGLVQAVVIDFHGDPAALEGDLVAITAGALPAVGSPLPWPRAERQTRLDAAQWTQAEPIRRAKGEAWAAEWDGYMQALRDLPKTQQDAASVAWPVPPAA